MRETLMEKILETLFPISCVLCGQGNDWICKQCLSKIPIVESQRCPICEKVSVQDGSLCDRCRKHGRSSHFSAAILATGYSDASRLIHLLKYRFVTELASPLGKLMADAFVLSGAPLPDTIVPVPIHPSRMRARGFNQSELLSESFAAAIAPGMGIPVIRNSVSRIRRTPPQMRIGSFQERLDNMKDAFMATPEGNRSIKGKRVLLVDDVITTGATVSACASALAKAGPKEIRILAIARQESK